MRCPRVAYFLPVLPAALVSSWLVLRPSPSADLAAAPPEAPATKDLPAPGKDRFAVTVKPVFAKYCVTCHNDKKKSGELSLERLTDTASASKERDLWDKVKEYLGNREMPPKGKPQPSEAERQAVIAWIDTATARADCDGPRDPGRPTIRRLNRVEYDNTIRDLIGLNLKPADVFPSDDVGYGFDNIGDVLSLPPILLEKYLAAAEKVLDAAVVVPRPIVASKDVFRSQNVRTTLGPFAKQERRIAFTQNGAAFLGYDFAYEGEYVFRARAYGEQAGDELPKLVIQLDRNAVSKHDVEAVAGKPKLYEGRAKVSAGRHEVRFEFTNHFEEKADKDQKPKARNLYIDLMEVEGPFHPVPKPLPESHKRIFITKPTGPGDREAAARTIIEKFATRAYRRPVRPGEVERLMKLYQFAAGQEETFEAAVKHALKAVLVSPHFLFRIERDAGPSTRSASMSWRLGCRTSCGRPCRTRSCTAWPTAASSATRASSRRRSGACSRTRRQAPWSRASRASGSCSGRSRPLPRTGRPIAGSTTPCARPWSARRSCTSTTSCARTAASWSSSTRITLSSTSAWRSITALAA
jgi:mono/diheme cytochrome c family protein